MNEFWQEYPVKRGIETALPIPDIINGLGYIAGSWAAFMAAPDDTPILPNDIDIFATSVDNAAVISKALCDKWDVPIFNGRVYSIARSPKAPDLQVICPNPKWQTWPDDLLNDFDLDVSRAVVISPDVVIADFNVGKREGKLLRINNPLRTMKRVMKYVARGVKFSDWELLKLFSAWEHASVEHRAEIINDATPTVEIVDSGFWDDEFDEDDDWFEGE